MLQGEAVDLIGEKLTRIMEVIPFMSSVPSDAASDQGLHNLHNLNF